MKYSVIVLCVSFLLASCGKKNDRIQPQYRNVVQAVYATGILMPADEYKVFAQQDGILTALYVDERDTVRIGQALCDLDSDVQNAKYVSSRQALSVAELNSSSRSAVLKELESSMDNARAKLADDSISNVRYSRLQQEKAVSTAEFDRISLKFRTSKKEYDIAKQRYEQTKERLKVELENARAQNVVAERDRKNVTLASAINGMVYELYKEKGELVKKNDAVALLGSHNKLYAKLLIDELDIGKVIVGQDVFVSIDSYDGKIFKAKVSKIYPLLNRQDQTIRVDAEFLEMPPPGMAALTIEGNIVIRSSEKALTIPKAFMKGKDSLIIDDGGVEKTVKVTIGAHNYDYVEVLSGISPTTTVVKP